MKTLDKLKLETAKKIRDAGGDCGDVNCSRCPKDGECINIDKDNLTFMVDYISKHEGETMNTSDEFLPVDSIEELENEIIFVGCDDGSYAKLDKEEAVIARLQEFNLFKRNPDFKEQPTNKLDELIGEWRKNALSGNVLEVFQEISKQLKDIKG